MIIDGLAISFSSEEQWKYSKLNLQITKIDEDTNDDFSYEEVTIYHASSKLHVREHHDWIKERIRFKIHDGKELWNSKEELFTHLEFCDSVKQQMQNIQRGNPMLRQVVKRLNELESYCENWTTGSFDSGKISTKVTPESQNRINQLQDELTFKCPDGSEQLFSYHARMTPGAWRLHFYPEAQSRKIIIGYIGVKIQ